MVNALRMAFWKLVSNELNRTALCTRTPVERKWKLKARLRNETSDAATVRAAVSGLLKAGDVGELWITAQPCASRGSQICPGPLPFVVRISERVIAIGR